MDASRSTDHVAAVRRFNRFYTRRIGVLQQGLLRSPYSLAEVRVLYELAHRDAPTAAEIGRDLGLDAGYLSRMLRRLERSGLVERTPSERDGRQQLLRLTTDGRAAFADLDRRSAEEVTTMLAGLDEDDRRRLVGAMDDIERLLGGAPAGDGYELRPHRPGDMGWVVERHGTLYWREYGWDVRFEALVARVVADFVEHFDPARERCWIAERGGERVGSVFVVKHPEREGVAKLRLLLVEPSARGLGLGRRLVDECTRFAREAGYHTITLWTNSVLDAARHIYRTAGYRLVHTEAHSYFGPELVSETWEMALRGRDDVR